MFLNAFCLPELCKTYQANFHETWWKDVAWDEEEPSTFWGTSESQCGDTNLFSLLLMSQYTAFGLGRGLFSLSFLNNQGFFVHAFKQAMLAAFC